MCEDWINNVGINSFNVKQRYIKPWFEVVTGHHGIPPKNGLKINNFFMEEDKYAAKCFLKEIQSLFLSNVDLSFLSEKAVFKKTKQISWQLAGIAVLSDWLGSNQENFKYKKNKITLKTYWEENALNIAEELIHSSQFSPVQIEPYRNIQQLFPFINKPTPLQHYAMSVELSDEPQIFMFEDVTGAGKTEAAMVLAHRLMSAGLSDGLYIGLPTMATANGMYRRLATAYRKLYKPDFLPSLVLAHGAARYNKEFTNTVKLTEQDSDSDYHNELSATAFCNAWIADSQKKSLLADVGVGTLDQVLLSILPARHQSLRLLGLSRKILLVDEVHAYDKYMQTLLETLLEAHARQGGNVILLSATLPNSMRSGLAKAFMKGRNETISDLLPSSYPLATQLSVSGKLETIISTRKEVEREVKIITLENEKQVLEIIKKSVKNNQCICWIRNTVKDAVNGMQKTLSIEGIKPDNVTLFHSRFAMIDRQSIENKTLDLFGKTEENHRSGQVLIATQVVEQSLDLDFDVLISDIAPVDLIIQRAGRLHRHVRSIQGTLLSEGQCDQRDSPVLYLLTPMANDDADENWLKPILPTVEYVYPDIGQLWLTAKLLIQNKCLKMPDHARELIEAVYGSNSRDKMPEAMQDISFMNSSVDHHKQHMATQNALLLDFGYTQRSAENNSGWNEDVNTPTRLTDASYTIALAKIKDDELVPYAVITDEDESTLWAMSCISLRANDWEKVEVLISEYWQKKIIKLKVNNTNSLRWLEILPLTPEIQARYSSKLGWNGV
ncbi:CRISPR-associated helicase Cas3' [bacterium]|nr:CRISPR-associated helicase Cas3' [bacterium]